MDSNLNLFFLTVTILVIITYIIFIWTHKTPEDITKLFQDCFFDNVEPKDFLLKLPKVEDELMYEVFNLYHTYWHVRTCGPNRYKNCEMPLINVNAKMMHRGNYKEINKMIFYTINNPTVVKK